jgi:predicted acyl esterase
MKRPTMLALILLLAAAPASALVYLPLTLPMRDGTDLATDFYLPDDWATVKHPTLLIRTPYDKNLMVTYGAYADQGIAVVIQDARGRFASEGTDAVFFADGWGELQDGFDTCLWIAAVGAWYDGRIVTWGGSALAIIQYQLAGAAPPGLVGQVLYAGAVDLYDQVFYPGGVLRQEDITNWLDAQGSLFFLATLALHPEKNDFWEIANLHNRADVLTPAAYHVGGWFDLFSQGTIDGYEIYKYGARLDHQYLVMGPWTHAGFFLQEQNELVFPENATRYWEEGESLPSDRFLFAALRDELNGFDEPSVVYYLMGDVDDPDAPGNIWREADDWPPASDEVRLYLQGGGGLYVDPAPAAEMAYDYDPDDPTPSLCGLSLTFNPGPCDVSEYDARDDLLYFETPELPAPVEVTGRVFLDLAFTSSATDTDFTAFLVDVYPDGRKMLFLHGILRASFRDGFAAGIPLVPGERGELSIDLWSTSLVFNTGHKIGLYVASANSPMHAAGLNNFGQHPLQKATAHNAVFAGDESALVLPVVGPFPWQPTPDDDSGDDTIGDDSGDDAADDDSIDDTGGDDLADDDSGDGDGCCG